MAVNRHHDPMIRPPRKRKRLHHHLSAACNNRTASLQKHQVNKLQCHKKKLENQALCLDRQKSIISPHNEAPRCTPMPEANDDAILPPLMGRPPPRRPVWCARSVTATSQTIPVTFNNTKLEMVNTSGTNPFPAQT